MLEIRKVNRIIQEENEEGKRKREDTSPWGILHLAHGRRTSSSPCGWGYTIGEVQEAVVARLKGSCTHQRSEFTQRPQEKMELLKFLKTSREWFW